MHKNKTWEDFYKNGQGRNEKETIALKLLGRGDKSIIEIMEESQMGKQEFLDFLKWAKDYETKHLCR